MKELKLTNSNLVSGKWRSQITKDRVVFNLGTFKTKEEAALAYNEKAKKLFGDFALLNPL